MKKEKLPLYDPQTGIHRAKTWEIAFYAMNNLSTNLYGMIFTYASYYLTGIVGASVALAGILITLLRVWDGVTDPFIGFVVDRTNGKFGKNRPFIVVGQACMFLGTALIFLICPRVTKGLRLILYIIFYMFYIIGYTFQCVVTKSAQTCLTNDPKQRPVFSIFDTIYNTLVYIIVPVLITRILVPMYNVTDAAGNVALDAFYNPDFYVPLWLACAIPSVLFAALAILGLRRKDRQEFYGTGEVQRIRLRDYWDTIRHNRAIQMLCVTACSDKLAANMRTNAVTMTMLFGIVIGNYATYASFSMVSGVCSLLISFILIYGVARHMGQREALMLGSYVGIAFSAVLFLMLYFGDPTTIGFSPVNLFTVLFVIAFIVQGAFGSLSTTLVIPMTADCADYEVYRTGRYVPGLMGTLFSFIDKLVSSLSTTIISLMLTTIGFVDTQPTPSTPYSSGIFWVTIMILVVFPMIGNLLNVIAMHFYPLTKSKMAEIQVKIAEIKRESKSGQKGAAQPTSATAD